LSTPILGLRFEAWQNKRTDELRGTTTRQPGQQIPSLRSPQNWATEAAIKKHFAWFGSLLMEGIRPGNYTLYAFE
jgi:hypothetical protein